MTNIKPHITKTSSLSCQQLGVCKHPVGRCLNHCALDSCAIKSRTPFAPGTIDGPHRRSHLPRSERISLALVLLSCAVTVVVVLVHIASTL